MAMLGSSIANGSSAFRASEINLKREAARTNQTSTAPGEADQTDLPSSDSLSGPDKELLRVQSQLMELKPQIKDSPGKKIAKIVKPLSAALAVGSGVLAAAALVTMTPVVGVLGIGLKASLGTLLGGLAGGGLGVMAKKSITTATIGAATGAAIALVGAVGVATALPAALGVAGLVAASSLAIAAPIWAGEAIADFAQETTKYPLRKFEKNLPIGAQSNLRQMKVENGVSLQSLDVSMPSLFVDDWLKKSGAKQGPDGDFQLKAGQVSIADTDKPSWARNEWSRVQVSAAHRA